MFTSTRSSEPNLFDTNFGYASITDLGLTESLDSLYQRHESLLTEKTEEDVQSSKLQALTNQPLSNEQEKDILGQNNLLANPSMQSVFSTGGRGAQPRTNDSLTGMAHAGTFVDYSDVAIAALQQAFSTMSFDADATSSSTNQAFSVNAQSNNWRVIEGSLGADTFRANHQYAYNVFSGNGNVQFGDGYRDLIDLSYLDSGYIKNHTFARLNIGDGERIFDAFQLKNNSYIFFESIDKVVFADGVVNLSVTPNDTYFNDQWNLHMMGVHNAWRFTQGNDDVLIGVQDTGLGVDPWGRFHGDLNADETWFYSGNIRDELTLNLPGQSVRRDSSHGTLVQGIISAESNNGIGISGINWNSDVFAIDVLDNNSADQSLANATNNMIQFARSRGQKLVINMSLGGGSIDPQFERLVANSQQDALFVISSGNGDVGRISNPSSLAAKYNNVISVGASWGTETLTGRAVAPGTRISYPGWWGSNYGFGLSLMGPSEVLTTDANQSGFSYEPKFNGTSAAAPNVAGVASLVWSVNDRLSASSIKSILMETAYDLGARGYDHVYGSGFVNADAAVRRALALA